MKVPLLNFAGGPGTPRLYVERGPGVSFLNFRGSRVPLLNFKGGPGSGVLVSLLHHAVVRRCSVEKVF